MLPAIAPPANPTETPPLAIPDTDLTLLPRAAGQHSLWVDPVTFVQVINAVQLACWALALAQRLQPRLPRATRRGHPEVYSDVSILLTSLVAMAWRRPMEGTVEWLAHCPPLALALGYPQAPNGQVRTISLGRYSERRRALGLLPYFLFFVGMVWQLIRLGVIKGTGLILDSSLLEAWYQRDPWAAWSYPSRAKGSLFGFKLHAVLCQQSCLPVFFVITPANVADSVMAIGLLWATVALYGFRVAVVWADAAYWTYSLLGFIRQGLGASPVVDYNLRRKGKRFLATRFFADQWQRLRAPRSAIERYFAWAKRYYGLKYFQVQTLGHVTRHAFLVNTCMLGVALVAVRYQRPEWMLCRSKVLAFA